MWKSDRVPKKQDVHHRQTCRVLRGALCHAVFHAVLVTPSASQQTGSLQKESLACRGGWSGSRSNGSTGGGRSDGYERRPPRRGQRPLTRRHLHSFVQIRGFRCVTISRVVFAMVVFFESTSGGRLGGGCSTGGGGGSGWGVRVAVGSI